MEVEKKFLVLEHFSTPGGVINALQLLEALSRKSNGNIIDICDEIIVEDGRL